MIALLNSSELGVSLFVFHDKAKRTGKSADREPTHDMYALVIKKKSPEMTIQENEMWAGRRKCEKLPSKTSAQ